MNITEIDSLWRIVVLKSAWRFGHLEFILFLFPPLQSIIHHFNLISIQKSQNIHRSKKGT
jgi:hypothetical protein